MRRLAILIVLGLFVGGWYYFFIVKPKKEQTAALNSVQVYMGDGESGCLYPVAAVSDGKDPIWWSESPRQWNEFSKKQDALDAGFHDCAEQGSKPK